MTYTVKNGTWCKDNDKEYYSCTLAGLRAARAAGEIPEGTRVVIHEPKYNPGDLVKSFNSNCPEGCFVPDGSAFDTGIYKELAEVFPDGNLPDLRECVLVMVGRSNRPEITNHDEYSAGEFKNDQAAAGNHTHTVHVSDPGHDHGRGSFEITGSFGGISNDDGKCNPTGAFTLGGSEDGAGDGSGDARVNFTASRTWSGRSEKVGTGISVSLDPAGDTGADTTHGKQVGVYYYIAF